MNALPYSNDSDKIKLSTASNSTEGEVTLPGLSDGIRTDVSHEAESALVMAGVAAGIPIELLKLVGHRLHHDFTTIALYLRVLDENGESPSLENGDNAAQWELDLLDLGVAPELLFSCPIGGSNERLHRGVSDLAAHVHLPKIAEIIATTPIAGYTTISEDAVREVIQQSKYRDAQILSEFENYRLKNHPNDGAALQEVVEEYNYDLEKLKQRILIPLSALPSDTPLQMRYTVLTHEKGYDDGYRKTDPTEGPALDVVTAGNLRDAIRQQLVPEIRLMENNLKLLRSVATPQYLQNLDDCCDEDHYSVRAQICEYTSLKFPEVCFMKVPISNNGFNRSGWFPIESVFWSRDWSVVESDDSLVQQQRMALWGDTLRQIDIKRIFWDMAPSSLLPLTEKLKAYGDILQVAKAMHPDIFKDDLHSLAERFHRNVGLPHKFFGNSWAIYGGIWEESPCYPLFLCEDLDALKEAEKKIFPDSITPTSLIAPDRETVAMVLSPANYWKTVSARTSDECVIRTYGCDLDDVQLRVDVVIDNSKVDKRARSAKFYRADEGTGSPLIKSKFCSLVVFALLEHVRKAK